MYNRGWNSIPFKLRRISFNVRFDFSTSYFPFECVFLSERFESVQCISDGYLWGIHSDKFRSILKTVTIEIAAEIAPVIEKVKYLFENLTTQSRELLSRNVETIELKS